MTDKIIKCAKCLQNAEQDWNRFRDEYTVSYPIRDKDGKIYCWDCFKSFSSCKGCGKSVANIKFPRSGQPEYPRCTGGYSTNCERISNNVEFICSKECSKKLADQEYQAWKEKLNTGWTKCEECLDLVKWITDEVLKDYKKQAEKWKKEKTQSRLVKLVHPGTGKLCDTCEHREKVEKPRKAEIKAQAQKHWDTLPYETRLKEVIRTGSVGWGNFYKSGLNAEQIAAQNEVPYGIVYEFELKDCHRDCSDCHLDQDFKNSNSNNNLSASSRNGKHNNPYNHLPKEQNPENFPSNNQENYSKEKIIGAVGILTILALGLSYLVASFFKGKKSKKK